MSYKTSPSTHPSLPITPALSSVSPLPPSPSAIPALRIMWAELGEDIDRYCYLKNSFPLKAVIGNPGLWVLIQYRVSRWVHYYFHVPLLRPVLKLVCAIWQKVVEVATGVELPNRAEVGGGLFMPHANGIVIHVDAKIGRNCNIGQQVTVGVGGDPMGTPTIGDRVFLGPGVKVLGPLTIGDDVAVGANAVVVKDVPAYAVAVGIPAKVISSKGSMNLVRYRGCPH
jgi:serine O-acetyltransferase